jgi:pimeloyl-ACP methyl ester carboxylesterase
VQFSDRAIVAQLQLRGFTSHHLATSAGRVHVLDAKGRGDLPPLVVLHGFSAAAHWYDGVLHRMRRHARRIVAPDLLGHGLSEMPASGLDHARLGAALLESLDRVLDEPAIVFGNSLGGAAALKLAALLPQKVRGLFLVAPGGAAMDDAELEAFVDRFRLRTHDQALDFVDRLFVKRHPMRHVLAWGTRQKFARPGLCDLIERVGSKDLLRPSDLASIAVPIEVLWGGADRILHASHLEFYRRHLPPHARLTVVEHFGHTPHMDHPEDLHRRLLAFAAEVARRPAHSAIRPDSPAISAAATP